MYLRTYVHTLSLVHIPPLTGLSPLPVPLSASLLAPASWHRSPPVVQGALSSPSSPETGAAEMPVCPPPEGGREGEGGKEGEGKREGGGGREGRGGEEGGRGREGGRWEGGREGERQGGKGSMNEG